MNSVIHGSIKSTKMYFPTNKGTKLFFFPFAVGVSSCPKLELILVINAIFIFRMISRVLRTGSSRSVGKTVFTSLQGF